MDKIVYFLSGEFVLKNRPNGGTAVWLRSLWVTFLLYVLVIPVKSYCMEGALFQFSSHQLRLEIGGTLPWIGAIFAGVYVAFYARFAAQWSYLAGLYNQIMAACIPLSDEQRSNNRTLNAWRAAFIEDAQDLHLARKSMFKSYVIELLADPRVIEVFLRGATDGALRIGILEPQLGVVATRPVPVDP